MKPIAHIENDFPTKFGIPRQSGLVNSLHARIVMEPEYRNPDAFRGLEDYSHIWLIWEFSQAVRQKWSPTVRPPRLGGNVRMGVFATRSPFRPNPLGLSVVQLEEIVLHGANAPYLTVSGADLMHGTPIYDIKPYLPHIDSHPEARGGSGSSSGSSLSGSLAGESAGIPAGRADRGAGTRPPSVLPARRRSGVWLPVRRSGSPLYRGRRSADGVRNSGSDGINLRHLHILQAVSHKAYVVLPESVSVEKFSSDT